MEELPCSLQFRSLCCALLLELQVHIGVLGMRTDGAQLREDGLILREDGLKMQHRLHSPFESVRDGRQFQTEDERLPEMGREARRIGQ